MTDNYEELDKFIDILLKDKNIDDNIDFTEIDQLVEEILKNKEVKKKDMFNKVQIKTVTHHPPKIKRCIVS
jgi:hypothetical protein